MFFKVNKNLSNYEKNQKTLFLVNFFILNSVFYELVVNYVKLN